MSDSRNKIFEAIDNNDTKEFSDLLDTSDIRHYIKEMNSSGYNILLRIVIIKKNSEMLTGLLNVGADPKVISADFLRKYIHEAANDQNFDMVVAILKHWPDYKKDLIGSIDNGEPLLDKVIRSGNMGMLKTFLAEGVEVSEQSIHLAARENQYDMFFAMLRAVNPDNKLKYINSVDKTDGQTLLYRAIATGDVRKLETLLGMGADRNSVPIDLLIKRIHRNAYRNLNPDMLFAILKYWPEHRQKLLNSRSNSGSGLLHTYVHHRNTKMVEALLVMGADPNLRLKNEDEDKNNQSTPLHLAASLVYPNRSEVYKLLLEYGADSSLTNEGKQTALDLANPNEKESFTLLESATKDAESVANQIAMMEKAIKAYEKEFKKNGQKLMHAALVPAALEAYNKSNPLAFRHDFNRLEQAHKDLENAFEKMAELQNKPLNKRSKKKLRELHLKRLAIFKAREDGQLVIGKAKDIAKKTPLPQILFFRRGYIETLTQMVSPLFEAIKEYQELYKKAGNRFQLAAMNKNAKGTYGEEKFNNMCDKLNAAYDKMISAWTQFDKLYTQYVLQEHKEKNIPKKLKDKIEKVQAEVSSIKEEKETLWKNAQLSPPNMNVATR